jgi:hypothetical protein
MEYSYRWQLDPPQAVDILIILAFSEMITKRRSISIGPHSLLIFRKAFSNMIQNGCFLDLRLIYTSRHERDTI